MTVLSWLRPSAESNRHSDANSRADNRVGNIIRRRCNSSGRSSTDQNEELGAYYASNSLPSASVALHEHEREKRKWKECIKQNQVHNQDIEIADTIRFPWVYKEECVSSASSPIDSFYEALQGYEDEDGKPYGDTLNEDLDHKLLLDDLRQSQSESVIAQINTAREFESCVIMKGWMEKSGQKLATWNWRFFVLRDDGVLSYYIDEDMKKFKGSIDVGPGSSAQISIQTNMTDRRYVFLIATPHRTTIFAAPNKKAMRQWTVELQSIGVIPTEPADPLRNTVKFYVQNYDKPHEWQQYGYSVENTHMEGLLLKRGHINKSWKERYFVIENNELQYFTTNKRTLKGSVPLKGSVVSPGMIRCSDGRKNYFVLTSSDHSIELHLNAHSECDMQKWVRALQRVQSVLSEEDKTKKIAGLALVVRRADEVPLCNFCVKYSDPNAIDMIIERRSEALLVTGTTGKTIPIGSQLIALNGKGLLRFSYAEARELLKKSPMPLKLHFISPPYRVGLLRKKSRSGIENWKERVVVLSNGDIRYYKKRQKTSHDLKDTRWDLNALKHRKSFPLYGCYLNLVQLPDHEFCIIIARSPTDKLILEAMSDNERMEWASVLYCSIRIASQGVTPRHSENLGLESLVEDTDAISSCSTVLSSDTVVV